MLTKLPQRLAFSGLLKSGKDYIAEQLKYQTLSFAEPLYEICRYCFGSCDKNNPRHRRFLQWVGQAGWGCHDEKHCPDDFDRAAMTILLRREGSAIWNHPCWDGFGRRADFWVVDLLSRLEAFHKNDNVVVTNVRFRHELVPMQAAHFHHYLVACSERTRRERFWRTPTKAAIPIPEEIDKDASEELARQLLKELPDERIIWSDHRPMPKGKTYLTVEQFINK